MVDADSARRYAADIPVERPREFALAINLKAVRALGLNLPPSLLSVASNVFE
jgi:putative ABC transport system substrate-binding protein